MSEKRRCYMESYPDSPPQLCDRKCKFFEDGLACPFRTPREFWDANLCQFCAKKITECGFGERVVRSRKTDDVVGCFGFEQKRKEK